MKYRSWTTSDIRNLRELHSCGFTNDRIAESLNRTRGSVCSALARLGLTSHNGKELWPGKESIEWSIMMTRETYDRFRWFCEEHGENPGKFLDSLIHNFMNLAQGEEHDEVQIAAE